MTAKIHICARWAKKIGAANHGPTHRHFWVPGSQSLKHRAPQTGPKLPVGDASDIGRTCVGQSVGPQHLEAGAC